MTIEPITPAWAPSAFGERVLAYTEAVGILADLTVAADNLHSSLTSTLKGREESLGATLDALRADAVAVWRSRGPRLDADNYDQARGEATARARSLERRARAAAEHAARLADLLETLEHYDTPDDLTRDIDTAARRYCDGHYSTDALAEPDLTALWQRLVPSAMVDAAAAEGLRRHFDARITAPYPGARMPDLVRTVAAWRESHLARAVWNADTYAYAIDTARSWDEIADLWGLLHGNDHAHLTGPETLRLRTRIADKVTAHSDPAAVGAALHLAVVDFNADPRILNLRVRMCETMADLLAVSEPISALGLARPLSLMCSHNRGYDRLAATAPDADPAGDDWAPAAIIAKRVARWREQIMRAATSCTDPETRDEYTPESRYELLYYAMSGAIDTRDHRALDDLVRVADEAVAAELVTPERHTQLRALAGRTTDTNGATE